MADHREQARHCLVADIGGTNLRLALAARRSDGGVSLHRMQSWRAHEFASFEAAAGRFLQEACTGVESAVISVAGRISEQRVRMTNLGWTLDAQQLEDVLQLGRVQLVNDLGAAAAAVPALTRAESPLLWPAPPQTDNEQRIVVVGAGTGLGVAGATLNKGRARIVDSEGGHVAYAPETVQEERVYSRLRQRYGRVSWERLISGPGLMNIYTALHEDEEVAPARSPEQILAAASAGEVLATTAATIFSQALAAALGDAVLMHGAWQGAYLVGSLPQAALPWLSSPACCARFRDKGPFAEAMAAVPVRLVRHAQPGLLGAACIALSGSTSPVPA